MKKASCYLLGLLFSFFYGFADVIISLVTVSKIEPLMDSPIASLTAVLILGILLIAILIPMLIMYFKTIKNRFNGSDLMVTLMVILGVILAVIGGINSFFEFLFSSFDIMEYIIIFGIPVVSIIVGTMLAISEGSQNTMGG